MKPQQKQPKKTLEEVCLDRIHTIHDAKREKEEAIKREKDRILEDEIMLLTHGPNWRTQYAGEGRQEIKPPEDSQVRLKAS